MRNITRYLIILLSTVLLSSCWSPDIEDAQELGFSSIEEMTRVTSQGYKTKKEYDERYKKYGFESVELMEAFQLNGYGTMSDYEMVKGRTPEWFVKNCKGESDYMTACFGKRIIWYGMVNSVGPNSATIDVRGDKGIKLKTSNSFALLIDSKSLKRHGVKKGQLIEFHGRIDQKNLVKPDIENISFVRFESKDAQILRNKKLAEKVAQKERREEDYKEKLNGSLKMFSENSQKELLSEILHKSGKGCGKATRVFLQLKDKDVTYWNISCSNSQSYAIQIPTNPSENTRILECSIMRALNINCFEKL